MNSIISRKGVGNDGRKLVIRQAVMPKNKPPYALMYH